MKRVFHRPALAFLLAMTVGQALPSDVPDEAAAPAPAPLTSPIDPPVAQSDLATQPVAPKTPGAPNEPLPAAPMVPSSQAPVVLEFVAAMQRIRQRTPDLPDSQALQAYVIHDYLVAARLRRDLGVSAGNELDDVIDAFVRAHAGQPVVHALRREWLASLADRRRWDWFLPRANDVVDSVLVCDRLAGRLASGDTAGLEQDALMRWSLVQKPPDECNSIFVWLRSRGAITPDLAEKRARAALAADNARLAREFIAEVPAVRAAPLKQWLQLLDAPRASIGLLAASPSTPVEPDALVAGFSRFAVADNAAALNALPSLLTRPDMTSTLRNRLQRAAALGAAYSRTASAVAAFELVSEDATDIPLQEWRVRAALWSGDFAKAAVWLEHMSPTLAALPRWRYWRARAMGATVGAAAAAPLYAELAGMRDFYGYLAADRLNQPYNLNIRPSPNDEDAQGALAAEPGLLRAHALFDCGLTDDAGIEWSAVLSGATPAVKTQAAHLASRWGWYAQTIATLAQAGEWDDVPLRYPRPYAALVAAAGKETGVADDWLLAIMRQESLFRRDAVSRADARGLMQMLPATAVAVARRWNLAQPTRDSLFEPPVAVTLGAWYVHELLDRYRGQLGQSWAAYNAGP